MKKSVLALLLIGLLALSACKKEPETYQDLDPFDYLTPGEYKGLSYTPADTAVSDYELRVKLNKNLSDGGYVTASEEEIREGAVEIGDTLNIDYSGKKDGVAFDGGTAQGQSLTIGSGRFIAGFEEGLVGVRIGDTVDLDLKFPDNYSTAELAGAAVVFTVTVNYVESRPSYAVLTDEIAAKLDKTVATAAEYTEKVRKELEDEKVSGAETKKKNTLWDAVIENAKFKDPLPAKLVDQAVGEFTDYWKMNAKQQGYDTLNEFFEANGITQETFDKAASNNATAIVKSQLAAYAIAKAEGKTFSEEEIRASAENSAKTAGYTDVDQYIERAGKEAVHDQAVLNWAVDLVLDTAVAETP